MLVLVGFIFVVPTKTVVPSEGPPLGDPHFRRNRRFQGYTPEDVLPPGPQATSELDVLYHSVMHDKCVGGALPL